MSEVLSFTISPLSSHLHQAVIEVDQDLVSTLRNHTLKLYQQNISLPGFKLRAVPSDYILQHYKKEIYTNVKGFFFTHFVLSFLMKKFNERKMLLANHPRLTSITITPEHKARYIFEVSVANPIKLKEWKHFVFKSPKRKNYKDLDKQVSLFMKHEQTSYKKKKKDEIENGDWVCFSAAPINNESNPFFMPYATTFWLKINTDDILRPLTGLFLGKKVPDSFITDSFMLEDIFTNKAHHNYRFQVTLKSIVKGHHLSLENFKANFKLKSKADVHKKLIEVFSYRNDLSQRKSIIEEVFHLFFSKHRFEVPKHIVIRKQEELLLSLKKHPDYHVYKTNDNFKQQLEMLAEKQLKEEILIDQIGYNEDILLDSLDIQNYLNLFSNERLKEFVYFKPSVEKMENPEMPLHPSILKQAILREKTLNHVIHVLTR